MQLFGDHNGGTTMKVRPMPRGAAFLTCLALSAVALNVAPLAAAADRTPDLLDIDQKNFSRSTIIDNKWMPLRPGTQWIYEGSTVEDGKKTPHRIIFTVTDLVKVIDSIPAVVMLDKDFSDGKLEEQELTFFAQDDEGKIWQLGENSETYDETQFIGGRAWIVGHLKAARAGIMIQAKPREGMPSYSEGFAPPPYRWADHGRIRKLGEKVTVPAGAFSDVLVIEEFSEEEPGAFQLKYYAPGIGNIRTAWEGKDPKKETLELARVVQLGPQEMDAVRVEALQIEERAYVYGSTPPAQRRTE